MMIPYFFLVAFPWGLYDSVHVFSTLLGIYWLTDATPRKEVLAVIMFSLAISCKIMVAFVVFPLLFYHFKNIFKLMGAFVGSFAVMGIEILLYGGSEEFNSTVRTPMEHFVNTLFNWEWGGTSIYLMLLIILCIIAFQMNPKTATKEYYVWFAFASSGIFIASSTWNPNWIILLVPYYAILLVGQRTERRKLFYLLNLCLSVAAVGRVISNWNDNYGEPTLAAGVWGKMLLSPDLWDVRQNFLLINDGNGFFTTMLYAPENYRFFVTVITAVLVYAVYFLYPERKKSQCGNAELLMWGSEKLYRNVVGILSWIVPVILWGLKNSR